MGSSGDIIGAAGSVLTREHFHSTSTSAYGSRLLRRLCCVVRGTEVILSSMMASCIIAFIQFVLRLRLFGGGGVGRFGGEESRGRCGAVAAGWSRRQDGDETASSLERENYLKGVPFAFCWIGGDCCP